MGIFEKLGIKKRTAEKPQESAVADIKPQASDKKEPEREKGENFLLKSAKAHEILIRPIVSEKGTGLAGQGRYVFAVSRDANKSEIKKSIQSVYNVTVQGVRIVNLPSKKRRYGRSTGETSAWKKAIVTVKEGERIPGIVESVG